jgi:hypothetical protein
MSANPEGTGHGFQGRLKAKKKKKQQQKQIGINHIQEGIGHGASLQGRLRGEQ